MFLVHNGPAGDEALVREVAAAWPTELGPVEVIAGHGNVGYGRANNLALAHADSDAHLVLNPDVEVDADALRASLASLREHPNVALLAPAVYGGASRGAWCLGDFGRAIRFAHATGVPEWIAGPSRSWPPLEG